MRAKPLADTPLAFWLDKEMSQWRDPVTRRMGISQRRLGQEEGLSQAQLSGILTEGHQPGYETLDALGKFFKVWPPVLYYIAYWMEGIDYNALDRITEIGRELYKLPEDVALRYIDSLFPQAEAIRVAAAHVESEKRPEEEPSFSMEK